MPPAPIGTNAPDLDVNSAFAYVVFTVATVFIILYSVYLALIREDEEEEDVEGGGDRRRGGANIDEDDEDDDEYGDRDDESTSTVAAKSSAVFSKLSNELKETISVGNERVKKSAKNIASAWTRRTERRETTNTPMSFMGALFGEKKKKKKKRREESSLLDSSSLSSDEDEDEEDENVESMLSVNEEDFFEEEEDEAMWAPYFHQ